MLQRLTASGYVEREANTGDGRSRQVQLTEEGCHVVRRHWTLRAEHIPR